MSCGPMLLTAALFCGEVCDVSCGPMHQQQLCFVGRGVICHVGLYFQRQIFNGEVCDLSCGSML